ncbi:ankyrin repeat domain-containing protein [Archangium lansingense]|uniref:ankyrin repeat domain-containing protein n=1 Tax=Archangium lansingense TaxID=2995310 RepID=UPI003B79F1D2
MSVTSNGDTTQALLSLCENKRRWREELNAATVKKLVAEGADVNARNKNGMTPLHLAVQAPYTTGEPLPDVDVVRALIEAGADVNARDNHLQTPVLRVVPYDDNKANEERALEIVRVLRDAGGQVPSDVKDGRGGAFTSAGEALYREVLDAGAAIDARDDTDQTPLHRAAARGAAPVIQVLLERGAEVNALDGLGRTPLGVALRTQAEPWVAANKRQAAFKAAVGALEAAGGKSSIPYQRSDDPFAPFPVDGTALSAALKGKKLSFKHEVNSAQEVATGLHSYGEPEQSLAKLEALRESLGVAPRKAHLKGPLTLKRAFFLHGDLEVDGDLSIYRPFAVTGNVIVHGVVSDNANDSLVNVLGNVKCHALNTDGEFTVGGDIEARDVVLGYYNDHILSAGTIKARVVIEDDHATSAAVEAELHFDLDTYSQGYGEGVSERLRELFVDEVFKKDEDEEEGARLDKGELFYRISKGLPVFRK